MLINKKLLFGKMIRHEGCNSGCTLFDVQLLISKLRCSRAEEGTDCFIIVKFMSIRRRQQVALSCVSEHTQLDVTHSEKPFVI